MWCFLVTSSSLKKKQQSGFLPVYIYCFDNSTIKSVLSLYPDTGNWIPHTKNKILYIYPWDMRKSKKKIEERSKQWKNGKGVAKKRDIKISGVNNWSIWVWNDLSELVETKRQNRDRNNQIAKKKKFSEKKPNERKGKEICSLFFLNASKTYIYPLRLCTLSIQNCS